jgi:pimeloyl-ACP methyl ester carboxylesterase
VSDLTVRRSFVDTPAGQIHVAECGSGCPVVLLHQTPRSWDEYREVLPLLGSSCRAIALDTIGMGSSAPVTATHSIEHYAQVAGWACDALGLTQIALVGHHTGGVIALELCAARPELVERLVLSSTPWVDAASRERRLSRPPIDHVDVDPNGSHLTTLWGRRQGFYPSDRPDLLHRFVRDALSVADPEAGHLAVGRYRMEDRVGRITCPTLCIGHAADPFAFGELHELADRIPTATTAIIEGGMVPLEYTASDFAALVAAFVAEESPVS